MHTGMQFACIVDFKVDFQSVLQRLNGLFWIFVLKNYSPIHVVLHKVKLQFLSPAILNVSFTLDEIEERDIEVAARPGQDNISVCTCTRFCLCTLFHKIIIYVFS